MKEADPQNQFGQLTIEKRLASSFGCDSRLVRVLREPGRGKFFIILETEREGKPWIIKATEPGINVGRLRTEARVLSAIPRESLKEEGIIVPEIFISPGGEAFIEVGGLQAIMISKISEGEEPCFNNLCRVIEAFQQKIPQELEIRKVNPFRYRRRTLRRLDFLERTGSLKGLGKSEVERIKEFYLTHADSLLPFDTVFVHGDLKRKHVRKLEGWLSVIDFDKSVMGSELEDWAWLSVRHPQEEERVKSYLEEKYRNDREKSANFERAFRLMQIDRLVEGYFTRTFQWRGNLDFFSYLAKTYGRYKLLSP